MTGHANSTTRQRQAGNRFAAYQQSRAGRQPQQTGHAGRNTHRLRDLPVFASKRRQLSGLLQNRWRFAVTRQHQRLRRPVYQSRIGRYGQGAGRDNCCFQPVFHVSTPNLFRVAAADRVVPQPVHFERRVIILSGKQQLQIRPAGLDATHVQKLRLAH